MDSFTKNRFLGWTVLALVLLNLLALGMLWTALLRADDPPRRPSFASRPSHPDRGRSSDIMHRALGLTPEQAGEVRALHQQHFAEMDGLQQEIHEARLRLSEAIFSVALGEAELHELADQVGEKWSLLEVKRFEHFKRIEALCDPQQKDRLKTLLEGVLTTVGPRLGGPHPGPPDGRPPRPRRRGMTNGS